MNATEQMREVYNRGVACGLRMKDGSGICCKIVNQTGTTTQLQVFTGKDNKSYSRVILDSDVESVKCGKMFG